MSQLSSAVTILSAVTATGAGTGYPIDGVPFSVVVTGITTATVAIQGSVDGTNYVTIGSALTADGTGGATTPYKYVRANVTAYTSGTITAKLLY